MAVSTSRKNLDNNSDCPNLDGPTLKDLIEIANRQI